MKQTDKKIRWIYRLLILYTLAFWFCRELAKPAISIALADCRQSSSTIGILLSLQNLLPLILSIPFATLGDKYGQNKILHFGSVITIISGVLFIATGFVGFGNRLYLIYLTAAQMLSGIAWTVSWISLQALISDCDEVNRKEHRQANGVNRLILIMSLGMILGPVTAGFIIQAFGTFAVWVLNIFLCIVQIVVSQILLAKSMTLEISTQQVKKDNVKSGKKEKSDMYHRLGGFVYIIMITFSFIMMFSSEIKGSYLSVVLRTQSISAKTIGYICSAGSLASFIVRLLMNMKFAEKISRKFMIYFSMLCSISAFILLTVLPQNTLYIIPSILIGLCGGIVEPVLIMYILENVSDGKKGVALAGRVLINRLAMFLAPCAAGLFISLAGINKGFGVLTLIITILIIFTVIGFNKCLKGGKLNESQQDT